MDKLDKLDSSPFPDDLREELAVQPRSGTSKLTLALGAGVVLVAGILLGIQANDLFGSPAPGPQAGAPQSGFGQPQGYGGGQRQGGGRPGEGQQQGGGQPGGFGQRMGGGGGATMGTVEKVEDGRLYVRTGDGATVTVTTDDKTAVTISKEGKVSDLRTGTPVVVRGSKAGDGTVTAVAITQGGQGGGPR
ncbi:hypothetical protein [Nonomuraea sp. NPDC050643]|uniref:hypothetical protein n=1 Tax=Nonomuraea sp. NPDC050643 TaxID=3155660 RepID=UPI0033DD6725